MSEPDYVGFIGALVGNVIWAASAFTSGGAAFTISLVGIAVGTLSNLPSNSFSSADLIEALPEYLREYRDSVATDLRTRCEQVATNYVNDNPNISFNDTRQYENTAGNQFLEANFNDKFINKTSSEYQLNVNAIRDITKEQAIHELGVYKNLAKLNDRAERQAGKELPGLPGLHSGQVKYNGGSDYFAHKLIASMNHLVMCIGGRSDQEGFLMMDVIYEGPDAQPPFPFYPEYYIQWFSREILRQASLLNSSFNSQTAMQYCYVELTRLQNNLNIDNFEISMRAAQKEGKEIRTNILRISPSTVDQDSPMVWGPVIIDPPFQPDEFERVTNPIIENNLQAIRLLHELFNVQYDISRMQDIIARVDQIRL